MFELGTFETSLARAQAQAESNLSSSSSACLVLRCSSLVCLPYEPSNKRASELLQTSRVTTNSARLVSKRVLLVDGSIRFAALIVIASRTCDLPF